MSTDDRLTLRGMRFMARHGVLPGERVTPQPFEVDLVLHADLAAAAERDDLAATIDYRGLFELVRGIVEDRSFRIIEALAGAIAESVLAATDPGRVASVEVRVRKPEAPLPGQLDTVEVALVRRRAG
ncbi:MAG: dihydroneopterin aldolase [Candidatus Limnocylindria bacterium]